MSEVEKCTILLCGLPKSFDTLKTIVSAFTNAEQKYTRVKALVRKDAERMEKEKGDTKNSSTDEDEENEPRPPKVLHMNIAPRRYENEKRYNRSARPINKPFINNRREERVCFYCQRPGHIKLNCRDFIAHKRQGKKQNSQTLYLS